jgi:hypothetical protein
MSSGSGWAAALDQCCAGGSDVAPDQNLGCLPHRQPVRLVRDRGWHDRYGTGLKAGVVTGVLGGYTTFSTMQLDAAKLTGKRHGVFATPYLLLSVAVGTLAEGSGSHLPVRWPKEDLP